MPPDTPYPLPPLSIYAFAALALMTALFLTILVTEHHTTARVRAETCEKTLQADSWKWDRERGCIELIEVPHR